MTTAIICDDEPRLASALRDQLKSVWPELNVVALGHSGGEALALIAEHEPDIAFLDIRMPGLSGVDVARHIAASESAPRIVFVTAYDEYAIAAFETRAIDYLLKPVKTQRLIETVARLQATTSAKLQIDDRLIDALNALKERPSADRKYLRWLNCGQGNEIDVIATTEVLCFQSRDKYTAVMTTDKERYIRTPLRDLLDTLDPDEFWQIHRSSVIRVSAIERVIRDDMGRMYVKLRDVAAPIAVSMTFSGRFKQM